MMRAGWQTWGRAVAVACVGALGVSACESDGGPALEQDVEPFGPDGATSGNDTTVATNDDTTATEDTATPPEDTGATTTTPEDTSTPADTTSTNPLGPKLTFSTESITITPGHERQVCKVVNIPGDKAVDIVRIESHMHGKSHHFNLYKVVDERKLEPASAEEGKTVDCPPAADQLAGDAAYIFGAATPERTMDTPAGVAFHLEAGQRMILEYHGLNYGTEDMSGDVVVDLVTAAPEAVIEHYADVMWMANWGFVLPQGEEHSDTAQCRVPFDAEVFMVMSHFHELGTNFKIDTVKGSESKQFYESEDWAHPEVMYFDPPMEMAKGDYFKWTCTWFNWRDHDVYPNKASTDEMCMIFVAAYPKDQLSEDPVQCNVLF